MQRQRRLTGKHTTTCLALLVTTALVGCKSGEETSASSVAPPTPPTMSASYEFAAGRYNPLPSSVKVTFSSTVDMDTVVSSIFATSGTCAGVSVGSISKSGHVATVSLSGTGSCNNGETVGLATDLSKTKFSLSYGGGDGSGSVAAIYTYDNAAAGVTAQMNSLSPTAGSTLTFGSMPANISYTVSDTDIDLSKVEASSFTVVNPISGTPCTATRPSGRLQLTPRLVRSQFH